MLVGPLCIFLGCEVLLVLLLCTYFKPIQSMGMAVSKILKIKYGGVVVKTVSACITVLLISTLVSLWRLNDRITTSSSNFGSSGGVMVDQVEFFGGALEASLMGERFTETFISDEQRPQISHRFAVFLKDERLGLESRSTQLASCGATRGSPVTCLYFVSETGVLLLHSKLRATQWR